MEKVLVTGAAGYVGSVLCEHLLVSGYQVIALDNLMYNQQSLFYLCHNNNFDFVEGDVRNDTLMRRVIKHVDVIIHLAAIVGAPACDKDAKAAESINYESVVILNRLRSLNQLVVFPTTNSGYGSKTGEIYCTEETPLEPISLYGKTKMQAEQELLNSRNTITLRLATAFGVSPRMRTDLLVNNFVYEAVARKYIIIYEKQYKRNFIHVRDIADCFVHCIENATEMVGFPYNVGLDKANISKEELAMKVQKHVSDFNVYFSDMGSDPDRRNYIVSSARIKGKGFEAQRSLEFGIAELLKCYKMFGRDSFSNT